MTDILARIDLTARPEPTAVDPGPDWAARTWAAVRICMGWIFLWPFLDKLFGLGFATTSESAWIRGGSPTNGFLSFGTRGPFAGFFQSFAGDWWADWLFMISLLAIGVALTLGIAMRAAASGGAALLLLMWLAALQPEHNPLIDDHIIYALVLVGLVVSNAGKLWGLGDWWAQTDIARRFPVAR